MMNSIPPLNPHALGCSWPAMDGKNCSSSQLTGVAVSLQQDTDFTIVTTEGDKVTLSYDSEFQAAYVTYDSFSRINGDFSRSQGEMLGFHASREFTISVDGDLNEQEIKDIKKALKTVSRIMRDFLSGDIDHAIARTMNIGDLESISSLEAHLQLEQIVYQERQSNTQIRSRAHEPAEDMQSPGESAISKQIETVTHEMAKVLEDSGVKPVTKMAKSIHELFTQLFNELQEKDDRDSKLLKIAKLIESRLLERIGHLSEKA